MDLSSVIKRTPELTQAERLINQRLYLRKVLGCDPPPTGKIPELTDQECCYLSQQFDEYTYYDIRKAFPVRVSRA